MDAIALASQIARRFKLFQCEECALAIRDALVQADIHGEIIEIRAQGKYKLVICRSLDRKTAVSENGRHLGVRIGDVVVDNLHPDGIAFTKWLDDFDSVFGVRLHEQTAF